MTEKLLMLEEWISDQVKSIKQNYYGTELVVSGKIISLSPWEIYPFGIYMELKIQNLNFEKIQPLIQF